MKKLLLLLLISINLSAYRVGDRVDDSIIEKLRIDDSKITVVDFFASWCASCKKEIPLVSKLQREVSENSSVEIIGVDVDKSLKRGKRFQKRMRINFRVHNDDSQEVIEKFSPFGMPSLYYIKDRKVVKMRIGALPKIDKKIKNDLRKLGAKL